MAYSLRQKPRKNYQELADVKLPRSRRLTSRPEDVLYQVDVVEEDDETGRVKVHYVGYGDEDDEWKDGSEIVLKSEPKQDVYVPFHLHTELGYQIKLALSSFRTDPDTRIEIPFDKFLFVGGMQQAGKLLKKHRGHGVYGITKYSDLVPILGERWHVRVLNKQLDFCYAKLETVRFYLYTRQPLTDFQPGFEDKSVHTGHVLIFRFVRVDGVKRHWDDVIRIA